jgi:hypothetical protein
MLVPFFAGGFVALTMLPSWLAVFPFAIGIVAMFAIHAFFVPLVPRGA